MVKHFINMVYGEQFDDKYVTPIS